MDIFDFVNLQNTGQQNVMEKKSRVEEITNRSFTSKYKQGLKLNNSELFDGSSSALFWMLSVDIFWLCKLAEPWSVNILEN